MYVCMYAYVCISCILSVRTCFSINDTFATKPKLGHGKVVKEAQSEVHKVKLQILLALYF